MPDSMRGREGRREEDVSRLERASRGVWRSLSRGIEYPLILAAVFLSFWNSLSNQYTFDDSVIIGSNVRIRRLDRPADIFLTSYWDRPDLGSEYRPLTIFTYALNYAVARGLSGNGLDPAYYHLLNLLLHALASCLVAVLTTALWGRRLLGAVTGLLFALHPIHTEAVAGIVGRAEILSAIAVFGGVIAWRRARTAPAAVGSVLWALAVLAAIGLGSFCKENALTLAGVVLLELAIWARMEAREGRPGRFWPALRTRHLPTIAALAIGAAAYLAARKAVLGELTRGPNAIVGFQDNPIFQAPTAQRIATALRIQGEYLWLLIWPKRLIADFSFNAAPISRSFLETPVLASVLALSALAIAFCFAFARYPKAAFAIGFYAITMSITSNLVIPIGTIKAERLLYLPSFGFCLLLALLFDRMRRSLESTEARLTLGALFFALCVAYGARSYARNPDWKNDLTLFASVVREAPENAKGQHNYGNSLVGEGDLDGALGHFRAALKIDPPNPFPMTLLGTVLALQGDALHEKGQMPAAERKYEEAETQYKAALRASPTFAPAHYHYAIFLWDRGRGPEALEHMEMASRLDPKNLDTLRNLARRHWIAADKDPENSKSHLHRTVECLETVVDREPWDTESWSLLGVTRTDLKDYEKALHDLNIAHDLIGKKLDVKVELVRGSVLLWLDRFDEAEDVFARILDKLPDNVQARLLLESARKKQDPAASAPAGKPIP